MGGVFQIMINSFDYKPQNRNMQYYSQRKSYNQQNSLTLHRVLKDFQHQQNQKTALINKINMFKINQQRTQSKALSMEKQIKKINKAKLQYLEKKKELNIKAEEERKVLEEKKNRKEKIQREKEKVLASKAETLSTKRKIYETTREESRLNDSKIQKNRQRQFKDKKKRSIIVKEKQELGRTKTKLYYRQKLASIKKQNQKELLTMNEVNNHKEEELKRLRDLEMEMIVKFSESMTSLRSSRSRLKHSKIRF